MKRIIKIGIMALAIAASVSTLFLVDFEQALSVYDCPRGFDNYVTTTQNRHQAQPLEEFEIFFDLLDNECFSKYSTWRDYSINKYAIGEVEWNELSQINKFYSGELECPFSDEYCQNKLRDLADLRWNLDYYDSKEAGK